MPRVLELFAKRGLVPSNWRSAVSGGDRAGLTIEIEMRNKDDGSRQARIDLTGTLLGGLLNASGSFLKGRPATLNWHKETGEGR